MKNYHHDTIAAPATASGRGGVAIVRVSGQNVKNIALKLIGKIPKPRFATYASFTDQEGEVVDQGIALFFPAPHSFTGEDVLELHCHGGQAITTELINVLLSLGARYARPGEFSERAFLHDKIDLVQAEAIADLIDASSTAAARSALRSLQGEFSKKIHQLVEKLIHLRMYVEAAIDFVEEEIDFLGDAQIKTELAGIIQACQAIQSSAKQGHLLRDGISIVIAGKPNAGKSSLLNLLSGKDTAIVTDIPGTTRDIIREHIVIDGMPVHVIDTAGLRTSNDLVEQEGIKRAKAEINAADIILFVTDVTETNPPTLNALIEVVPTTAKIISIRNKIDLVGEEEKVDTTQRVISLSAKHGKGIQLLKDLIKSLVGYQSAADGIFSARQRHLDALSRANHYIMCGKEELEERRAGELLAENLRLAQQALAEITGEFSTDDLLGRIFSSFCVGK